MVTRNDAGLGVFNGDIGITLKPAAKGAPGAYLAWNDGEGPCAQWLRAGWRTSRRPSP